MNEFNYASANPIIFTDPAGTCRYQPGDPEKTCRVEPGDTLYGIALDNHISPWTKIKEWNPERSDPSLIHTGNLIYLNDRNASRLADIPQPPSGFLQSNWLIDGFISGGSFTLEFPHDTTNVFGAPPNCPKGVVGGGWGSETIYNRLYRK